MFLNKAFFAFPFLLYIGIAIQGICFYLIAILLPSIFFLFHKIKIPNFFSTIGLSFLFLHILFPVNNFFNYFFQNKEVDPSLYAIEYTWPGILQSSFPSSLFFGGIALILFAYFSKKQTSKQDQILYEPHHGNRTSKISPLKYFLTGLAPASVLFLIILLYQYRTGIDLRSLFRTHVSFLSGSDLYKTGGYRVYGFYGHPLTAAGVTLAYATFSWTLLWAWCSNKIKGHWNFIPFQSVSWFKNKKIFPVSVLILISFSNFICLVLTGGRTASLAGILVLVLVPFGFYFRFSLGQRLTKNNFFTLFLVVVISVSSFCVAKNIGLWDRFYSVAHSFDKSQSFDEGNYRQYFWKTYLKMIGDKPIMGQGNYWLKQGVRDEYYTKMGLSKLPEKFAAHNIFLEILGATGVLGFLWICFQLYVIRNTLKNKILMEKRGLKPLYLTFLITFFANLIHCLTQNVFFDSSVMYIYISLLMVLMWEGAFGEF